VLRKASSGRTKAEKGYGVSEGVAWGVGGGRGRRMGGSC